MREIIWDGRTLDEIILDVVHDALIQNGNNKTITARRLKVSIRTLRNWIRDDEDLNSKFKGYPWVKQRYERDL